MEISLIYTTTPTREEALKIAHELLAERAIACANILGEMTSVYRWESQMHADPEWAMLLKTSASRVAAVTARIVSLHSYDCPCVISWNICGGHPDFLRWVNAETIDESPHAPD